MMRQTAVTGPSGGELERSLSVGETTTAPSGKLTRNVVSSAFALLGQGVLVKAIAYGGQVALTRLLTPELFGVFGICSYFLTIIRFLGDFGLSGALVQKKGAVNEEELHSVFTVQFAIMLAGFLVLFVTAPLLTHFYHLHASAMWLMRGMGFSVLLTAFRSIASVRLTREVRFGPVSLMNSMESLVYWAVSVGMAFLGFGVWSFLGGVLASTVAATITIYVAAPYVPRLALSREALSGLLRFGLPYQGLRVLNIVRGSLGPVILSALAGAAALGYVSWAYAVASIATFVTSNTTSVMLFPAFSRLQSDRVALGRAVERAIQVSSFTLYPALLTLVALAPLLVHTVYTAKWAPAVPAFYLVAAAGLISPIAGEPIYQLLLSVGRIRANTAFVIVGTLLEWALAVPLIPRFGVVGMLAGVLVVTYATGIAWIVVGRRVCTFRIAPNVLPYFSAALFSAVVVRLMANHLPVTLYTLLALLATAALLYFVVLWLGWRQTLRGDVRYIVAAIRPGRA